MALDRGARRLLAIVGGATLLTASALGVLPLDDLVGHESQCGLTVSSTGGLLNRGIRLEYADILGGAYLTSEIPCENADEVMRGLSAYASPSPQCLASSRSPATPSRASYDANVLYAKALCR